MNYSEVRGFNYQPSYGTTSLENWVYFNPEIFELELRRGKEYFPKFNTVRLWLSWDAYHRQPERFKANFEKALDIADRIGLKVIPCMLNRWHDETGYDNGGVYIESFLYPACWSNYRRYYKEYVADIVAEHIADPRILVWDICNEPFSYNSTEGEYAEIIEREVEWLTELYNEMKSIDSHTPISVSIHPVHKRAGIERVAKISDVFLIHPYYFCSEDDIDNKEHQQEYIDDIEMYCEVAQKYGKELLVTETCWGALNDEFRSEIIKFTLQILKKYNIGFLAHALHYSKVADLHDVEDGSVGQSYNLAFTTREGFIRPGHDVFNDY